MIQGDGDLLSLLPAIAYRRPICQLGYSRRSILLINAPELTRPILADDGERYPKNDLMVDALAPLIGDSIFVSGGERWRGQRRLIDPAFSHMRLSRAFVSMSAALDDYEQHLDAAAEQGQPVSLDLAMSHLTADIICRTVFSTTLQSQVARDVFDAFTVFERSCAQVELKRLIFDKPWASIPQHDFVLAACRRIREHLGTLLDSHPGSGPAGNDDIAAAVIAARGPDGTPGFTREELLDQLGVMFLAGHETTASALIWAFLLLAKRPDVASRLRAEVDAVAGDGRIDLEQTRRMPYVRNVFRETLRLYPPITFLPRVALEPERIGPYRVKRGTMLMISPWTVHRNAAYWPRPDEFDPDRFSPEREHELVAGAYLPFGQGPHVCVGAGFAAIEATLILARLARRYDFEALAAERIRPVARLTTRPAEPVQCRVLRRRGRS
jgi:cytochrome P450